MKTSYKAFAFAVLAAFVVALAVVPADDASATADTSGLDVVSVSYTDGVVLLDLNQAPTAGIVLTVMDSTGATIRAVTLPAANFTEYNGAYESFWDPTGYSVDSTSLYKVSNATSGFVYLDQTPTTPVDPTTYSIAVSESIENGTVTPSPSTAAAGATVTLTVTPATGYELDTLTVAGVDGTSVEVSAEHTFTMPAQNVAVSATFKASETPGPTPEPPATEQYTVTLGENVHATDSTGADLASGAKVDANSVITVSATEREGYTYVITPAPAADGTYTVTADVSFTVTYTATTPVDPEQSYAITVSDTEGGSVSVDKSTAKAGEAVVVTVEPDQDYKTASVTVNGTAISASGAAGAASVFATSATYGSWSVKDASSDSATLVQSYTTTQGKANTKQIVISTSADYSALAAEITGDSKYTIVDTSSITGAQVTAGWRSMGAAFLVKIAASADGYVANGVEVDGSSTYVYVLGDSITKDNVATTVLSIARELAAALQAGGAYTFTMPAADATVAATFIKYEEASLSGNVKTANTVFDEYQIVNITADTTLVSGASVTIQGILNVNEGVTLTIEPGAYLLVTGTANIKGTVELQTPDEDSTLAPGALIAYQGGEISISGNVADNGVLGTMGDGKLTIAAGSAVEVSETGAVVGSITVADSASVTVAGAFGYTSQGVYYPVSFEVAGTLTVDTEVPAQNGFSAKLTSSNAQVVVESIVYGENIESGMTAGVPGAVITVTDSADNSVVISTSLTTTAAAPADAADYPVNATATLSGITVSTTTQSVGMATVATIVLSGTVDAESSVEYGGVAEVPEYTLAVSVAVTGTTAASIAASAIGEGVALSLSGSVSIDAALALGKDVAVTSDAALTVKAAVDATNEGVAIANNKTLTVSGEGSITALAQITPALTSASYNGAYYTTTADRVTTYHYVTVDAALTALQNDVTDNVALYGEQTVTQNFTIANKDTVTLADGAKLTIGAKSGDDVTLTIAQGGKISLAAPVEKQITVNGTLYAEDFRNVNSIKSYIDSDVFSYALQANGKQDNKSWAKWTNVYTALDQAASGDIVKLQKDVELTKDVEIKDGVTLDADKYAVAVDNAVTLTVAGTLDLTDSAAKLTLAAAVEKTSSAAAKAAGSVAISGYVQYTDDAQIPEKIAGAYYSITAKNVKVNYLTSFANGLADVLKADSAYVALRAGSDGAVALGDASVSGDAKTAASIRVYGDLTGSVTLSYAELFVEPGYKIDATFAGNGGTIAAKGIAGTSTVVYGTQTYVFGFNVTDATYSGAEVIGFGGSIADYTGAKDAKVDTALTVSGTVYAMSYMDVSVDAFTVAGTLTITGEDGTTGIAGAKASSADVQGNLVIIAGSDLTVADLTVSGAVAVQSGKLTADKAVVTGSVDATAAENATAEFEVTHLYIGTDGKSFTGADASVTGNVDLVDYALAVPGATVPSSFNGADSAYVKTAYTVGNAAYLDAYGVTANTMTIASVAYSQENAKFLGWQNSDGVVATTELVGAAGFTSVSAKVDTAIYTIQITTDGGINYITIGGKLLTNTTGNVFTIDKLTYTSDLTLVYQGKAGYDISNVKIYQDGAQVSAIALTSATDYTTVEYQLIGSTASATAGQSTVTIDVDGIIKAIEDNTKEIKNKETNVTVNGGSSDDDNDLTNILLVVLVILILVMAILVAYRMMRS